MTWDEKVEMVKFLNDGNYENAVSYISEKEVDNQAMDMFVTGFDLTKMELLKPLKDFIMNFDKLLLFTLVIFCYSAHIHFIALFKMQLIYTGADCTSCLN